MHRRDLQSVGNRHRSYPGFTLPMAEFHFDIIRSVGFHIRSYAFQLHHPGVNRNNLLPCPYISYRQRLQPGDHHNSDGFRFTRSCNFSPADIGDDLYRRHLGHDDHRERRSVNRNACLPVAIRIRHKFLCEHQRSHRIQLYHDSSYDEYLVQGYPDAALFGLQHDIGQYPCYCCRRSGHHRPADKPCCDMRRRFHHQYDYCGKRWNARTGL